jgi:peptide/nickel transport system permease protein
MKHFDTWLGGVFLASFFLTAILAPWLSPYGPHEYSGAPLESPSYLHLLGTNDVGQDLLSELLYGSRVSLLIALAAGGATVFLGLLVGLIAGAFGGWVDHILMRLVDALLAIPRLPLMILIISLIGFGVISTILVLSLLFWPTPARMIRAQVMSLRSRTYLHLARSFGANAVYLIRRHLFPACMPIALAALAANAGRAVAMEAGLAFLGLGDPTAKSWGLMIRYGLDLPGIYLGERWLWWILPPAVCITLLILSFVLLSNAIEKQFNPRMD